MLGLGKENQEWKLEIGADRAGGGLSHTSPEMAIGFITQ